MSADNGIYIGIFGDGEIRIAPAQVIDSCWDENGNEIDEFIWDVFNTALKSPSIEDAYKTAAKLEEEHEYVEYGVSTFRFLKKLEEYEPPFVIDEDDYYDYSDEPEDGEEIEMGDDRYDN